MNNQINCHNEVIIIGRIARPPLRCNVKNNKALQLCIAVPNDENYELKPNYVYVNIIADAYNLFKNKIGQPIAINGHIESNYGQRIIVDVLSFIKEKSY